jgi:hypothetical protein
MVLAASFFSPLSVFEQCPLVALSGPTVPDFLPYLLSSSIRKRSKLAGFAGRLHWQLSEQAGQPGHHF